MSGGGGDYLYRDKYCRQLSAESCSPQVDVIDLLRISHALIGNAFGRAAGAINLELSIVHVCLCRGSRDKQVAGMGFFRYSCLLLSGKQVEGTSMILWRFAK